MDYESWGGCRTENEIPNGPTENVGWYNGTAIPLKALPGCVGRNSMSRRFCLMNHTLESPMGIWAEALVSSATARQNTKATPAGTAAR